MVCGSEEGVLDIFNWGEWGNISDRFPGHPMSVDSIVALSDSVVCTGASDGVIRYCLNASSLGVATFCRWAVQIVSGTITYQLTALASA